MREALIDLRPPRSGCAVREQAADPPVDRYICPPVQLWTVTPRRWASGVKLALTTAVYRPSLDPEGATYERSDAHARVVVGSSCPMLDHSTGTQVHVSTGGALLISPLQSAYVHARTHTALAITRPRPLNSALLSALHLCNSAHVCPFTGEGGDYLGA
jgi:hypothetical protein